MLSMKKVMLGAALVAGGLGIASTQANAAEVGIYVGAGAPDAYVPPCPGPGYAWVAGYYSGRYWVPGLWNFVGVRGPAPIVRFDVHRDFYNHRDFDRHVVVEHNRFRR